MCEEATTAERQLNRDRREQRVFARLLNTCTSVVSWFESQCLRFWRAPSNEIFDLAEITKSWCSNLSNGRYVRFSTKAPWLSWQSSRLFNSPFVGLEPAWLDTSWYLRNVNQRSAVKCFWMVDIASRELTQFFYKTHFHSLHYVHLQDSYSGLMAGRIPGWHGRSCLRTQNYLQTPNDDLTEATGEVF